MSKAIENEVVNVLSRNNENIPFESLQPEEYSPLNQAVIDKDAKESTVKPKNWNPWKPEEHQSDHNKKNMESSTTQSATNSYGPVHKPSLEDVPMDDAPEQDIDSDTQTNPNSDSQENQSSKEEEFELPTAAAKQAADTFLGMSDNIIEAGGSSFVKIKKHKEFYEYEEIVELIDKQNKKNIKRLQLEKNDKAMLKPLIVAVLKKKAKTLSPEQQLVTMALSIVMKKVPEVIAIRTENEMLEDRIRSIIQEEKGQSNHPTTIDEIPLEESEVSYEEENNSFEFQDNIPDIADINQEISDTEQVYDEEAPSLYESVVETIEDTPKS